MSSKDIEVDEDLPNFFEAVKLSQADELIEENKNMQQNYLFEHNDPDTIELLEKATIPKKAIQGSPWYQILSNFRYQDQFQYIGAFIEEREKLIEDGFSDDIKKYKFEQSDFVMILLNLAYIPDSIIRHVDFSKYGWSDHFREGMEDFKRVFESEHGRKWEFQNQALEKEYFDFKAKIDKSDEGLSELKLAAMTKEEQEVVKAWRSDNPKKADEDSD